MADFDIAFNKTMGHEGGYVNDAFDAGGETYRGISRRYNPGWSGWVIIDKLKTPMPTDAFNKMLYSNRDLNKSVKSFYKEHYWDKNLLDEFEAQEVADELFDTGVNMGVRKAAIFLQKSLNILNNNGMLYSDINEDGAIGNYTLRSLETCLRKRGVEVLVKVLNVLQGYHYINYMTESPAQERFAIGWLSRVNFIR